PNTDRAVSSSIPMAPFLLDLMDGGVTAMQVVVTGISVSEIRLGFIVPNISIDTADYLIQNSQRRHITRLATRVAENALAVADKMGAINGKSDTTIITSKIRELTCDRHSLWSIASIDYGERSSKDYPYLTPHIEIRESSLKEEAKSWAWNESDR